MGILTVNSVSMKMSTPMTKPKLNHVRHRRISF
jgi:hypothetical protein